MFFKNQKIKDDFPTGRVGNNMSRKIIFQIIVSGVFLAYVIFKVDLSSLWTAFLSISPGYYLISLLVMLLNTFILAEKYQIVMTPSGIYQTFLKLVKINLICRFYSMFLTSAIGQGVIRWHISTKNQQGRLKFLAVIFFERATFVFALCAIVAISLSLARPQTANQTLKSISVPLTILLLGLTLYFFFLNSSGLFNWFNRMASNASRRNKSMLVEKSIDFIGMFSMYHGKTRILVSSLFLSFAWQLFFLLRVHFLMVSANVPLDFVDLSWIASLVLMVQALPVSINGIGLRETAYAFLFKTQGLPSEQGVLIGILIFSQMLLISAIGGTVQLLAKE